MEIMKKKNRIFKTNAKFIKVREEKLFVRHNKTSNTELSEQRIPQVILRN